MNSSKKAIDKDPKYAAAYAAAAQTLMRQFWSCGNAITWSAAHISHVRYMKANVNLAMTTDFCAMLDRESIFKGIVQAFQFGFRFSHTLAQFGPCCR